MATTPPPTTVTLADVAAHLGVSRTTVSNAYNRPDQLSPKLRDRVLAAATDLGYTRPGPRGRDRPRLHRPGPDGARAAAGADRVARARLRPAAHVRVHRPGRRPLPHRHGRRPRGAR